MWRGWAGRILEMDLTVDIILWHGVRNNKKYPRYLRTIGRKYLGTIINIRASIQKSVLSNLYPGTIPTSVSTLSKYLLYLQRTIR